MVKKDKKSEFRKYREGLWLPYRYVLYSYWYQYLKIAHQENRKIEWKKYEEWGTPEELFSQSFRTWWEKNWKRLFAVEDAYSETGKFLMSTRYPKADAIKTALTVYRLKYRFEEKQNYQIYNWVMDNKVKTDKWKKPYGSLFDTGKTIQTTKEINRNFKRYTAQAERILQNVCDGQFP